MAVMNGQLLWHSSLHLLDIFFISENAHSFGGLCECLEPEARLYMTDPFDGWDHHLTTIVTDLFKLWLGNLRKLFSPKLEQTPLTCHRSSQARGVVHGEPSSEDTEILILNHVLWVPPSKSSIILQTPMYDARRSFEHDYFDDRPAKTWIVIRQCAVTCRRDAIPTFPSISPNLEWLNLPFDVLGAYIHNRQLEWIPRFAAFHLAKEAYLRIAYDDLSPWIRYRLSKYGKFDPTLYILMDTTYYFYQLTRFNHS